MRRVRATVVAVEKQYVLYIVCVCVCVCVCLHVCLSVALDIQHAIPVRIYDIFPHYDINGMA